ncbi:hypothetical protein OG468_39530 [Streptomyces zaomyceticus]|uniref:hypothetical protein n=1 Tax=Streptomyces zaomyceticus TaxID=68286 RepID=UPI00324DF763
MIEPLARPRSLNKAPIQQRGAPAARLPRHEADHGDETDGRADQGRGTVQPHAGAG